MGTSIVDGDNNVIYSDLDIARKTRKREWQTIDERLQKPPNGTHRIDSFTKKTKGIGTFRVNVTHIATTTTERRKAVFNIMVNVCS